VHSCSSLPDTFRQAQGIAADGAERSTASALFVHFGIGFGDAKRLLSTQVHPGEPFLVAGDEFVQLSGRIESHGNEIVVELNGSTGSQGGPYRGAVKLEEPFGSQGGGASGGATYMWFGVSTNSDPIPLIKKVNDQYRRATEKASKGNPDGSENGRQAIRSETNSTSLANEPLLPTGLNALLPEIIAGMAREDIQKVLSKVYPKVESQDGPWSGQTGYIGFKLDDQYSVMFSANIDARQKAVISSNARISVFDRVQKLRLDIVPYYWEKAERESGEKTRTQPSNGQR
jgi:hypothetical protein